MKKVNIRLITVLLAVGFVLVACRKSDATAGEPTPQDKPVTAAAPLAASPAASDVKNGFDTKPPVGTKAVCPVMKNEFAVSDSTQFSEYKGKFYVFCCPGCKPQFDADPEKYL